MKHVKGDTDRPVRWTAKEVVVGNTFWFLVLTIIGSVLLIRGVNSGLTYVLNLHRENSLFTYFRRALSSCKIQLSISQR